MVVLNYGLTLEGGKNKERELPAHTSFMPPSLGHPEAAQDEMTP